MIPRPNLLVHIIFLGGTLCAPLFPIPADAAPLNLTQAVSAALANNSDLKIQNQSVEVSAGALQQASGQFDWTLATAYGRNRDYRSLRNYERVQLEALGLADTFQQTDTTFLQTGIERQLRSGIQLGLNYQITTINDTVNKTLAMSNTVPVPGYSIGKLTFNMAVPLLHLGEEYARSNEAAAEQQLSSARLEREHAVTQVIYSTALLYWDYMAKTRILELTRESEQRVRTLRDEVLKLIAADEIPAAEISLAEATLSDKVSLRIATEQAWQESRMALARIMGMKGVALYNLDKPVMQWPDFEKGFAPDLEKLLGIALENRRDLAALTRRNEAAAIRVKAARINLNPRLDLNLSAGYSGLNEGGSSAAVGRAFQNNQVGPIFGIQLNLRWPMDNNAARGQLRQAAAAHDIESLRAMDLVNGISANLSNASAAVVRGKLLLAEAQRSAQQYQRTSEQERIKRRLGQATLIDVVTVEDRFNNSQINLVSQQQSLASAIMRLRFETGLLLEKRGETYEVDFAQLTSLNY